MLTAECLWRLMTELATAFRDAGLLKFDPKKTAAKQAKATAVIAIAKKFDDLPTLVETLDIMIEEQRNFVAWWKERVRRAGQPEKNSCTNALILSEDKAKEETGISHVQVSRWAKGLRNVEAYRAKLFGKAYAAAMAMFLKTNLNPLSLQNLSAS